MLTYNIWLIFMGMKQKKKFLEKNQNGRLKKTEPILNIFHENFRDWILG